MLASMSIEFYLTDTEGVTNLFINGKLIFTKNILFLNYMFILQVADLKFL